MIRKKMMHKMQMKIQNKILIMTWESTGRMNMKKKKEARGNGAEANYLEEKESRGN